MIKKTRKHIVNIQATSVVYQGSKITNSKTTKKMRWKPVASDRLFSTYWCYNKRW